jgi:L-threonylcarbamoyladenylate synthase
MNNAPFNEELSKSLALLQNGGLLQCTIKNLWIVTCDATNALAIKKLKNTQKNINGNTLHVIVAHDAMLERHVKTVPDLAYDIMDLSNKPTIIIYDEPLGVHESLIQQGNRLGVYVAQDKFCRYLINQLKNPLAFFVLDQERVNILKSSKEKGNAPLSGVDYMVNLQKEIKEPILPSVIRLANDGKIRVLRE